MRLDALRLAFEKASSRRKRDLSGGLILSLLLPLPPRPAPHRQQPTPQMSLPLASAWPLPLRQSPPHQIQRFATLTGPAAIRDEYCVRALNLTLRHLNLLPLSYLGGRRGMT